MKIATIILTTAITLFIISLPVLIIIAIIRKIIINHRKNTIIKEEYKRIKEERKNK